jgi:large subunit ribosomal protein L18
MLIAKKAKGKINKAILDAGEKRSVSHSRIYAAVKGTIDGGLEVPCDAEMFPAENRIKGEHIKAYAEKLKGDESKYKMLFSGYIKKGLEPENITAHFQDIMKKIQGVE